MYNSDHMSILHRLDVIAEQKTFLALIIRSKFWTFEALKHKNNRNPRQYCGRRRRRDEEEEEKEQNEEEENDEKIARIIVPIRVHLKITDSVVKCATSN